MKTTSIDLNVLFQTGIMKLIIIFSLYTVLFVGCRHEESVHFDFKKQGNGKPVIIFESGLGEDISNWENIQEELGSEITTVSYDRLGIGKSSSTNKPRTLENLTIELKQFLDNNDIKKPYILVGHSYGGSIVRSFQNQFPNDVIGLIL